MALNVFLTCSMFLLGSSSCSVNPNILKMLSSACFPASSFLEAQNKNVRLPIINLFLESERSI